MRRTKTACQLRQSTDVTPALDLGMIRSKMIMSIGEREVLWTVVVSDMINMMNNLVWFQISTNFFLHYKTMFTNIAQIIGAGMISVKYELIASSIKETAFPPGSIFPQLRFQKCSKTPYAHSRLVFSLDFCRTHKLAIRSAINTLNNNHRISISLGGKSVAFPIS